MAMIIYADVLLLINIIINSIILVLTAWITGTAYRWWRILLASLLGGIYVLGGGLPQFSCLYLLPGKLLLSVIMIYMAFGLGTLRRQLFLLGAFYIISFILGGAVIGWSYLLQSGICFQCDYHFPAVVSKENLCVGIIAGSGLVILVIKRTFYRQYCRRQQYKILVKYESRCCELTAFLDSGNGLCTILKGTPVILADKEAILPLFNDRIVTFLSSHSGKEWPVKLEECRDEAWLKRIELIPYRSVGGSSLLLGFRPDSVAVAEGNTIMKTGEVVIAIYDGELAKDKGYCALLHPQILKNLNRTGGGSLCA
jgi:stage II sporulation protein GA (sporulation sigma-E factor processing peptidase)